MRGEGGVATATGYGLLTYVSLYPVLGVMAARGMLENPAMFAGHGVNKQVLSDWVSAS